MSNLSSLSFAETSDQGAELILLHPTARTPLMGDDKMPVSLQLFGMDSDVYTQTVNKNRDSNIEDLRRKAKFSSAADDYKGAKLLAKCTIGWHGVVQGWIDGTTSEELAEFSYENAVKLYSNRGVKWIREQADEFVHDRANFSKASLIS